MKQSSEKTIKPTISDILLDIEDINCSYKTHFNKEDRNAVGYSKINNITVRIKVPSDIIFDLSLRNLTERYRCKDTILSTINRLSSYLEYEGFKKVHEYNSTNFLELQYNIK